MADNKFKLSTIIFKTTYGCDLRCLYCYEGNGTYKKQIDLHTVENAIYKVAYYNSSRKEVTFIWHGGEPLLLGLDFYKCILEIQRSFGPNFNFRNSIQTNGCLLSQEFIEFFAENDFKIGLSLDGPPEIHNIQRVLFNGKGSFNKVWEAKERIWSFNIRNKKKIQCAFIAVLTRNSLLHLNDFYNFFKENRLDVQISFLLHAGSAMDQKAINLHITPKEYGQAMIYLFDRWVKESRFTFSIKPFSHILRSFVSGVHHSCMFAGECYLDFLNIDPEGNIVPCGRWDKNQFCYGNINIDNFDDAFNSTDFHRYKSERSKVKNSCKKCQHFDICHGGCAFSGYMHRRYLSDRDYYCTGHKMLFDHMKKVVKKEISLSD